MTFADFEKTQKQHVFMPGWYMINILIGINVWKGLLKKLPQAEHLTIKSFVSQTALEILLLKSNNYPFAFISLLK